MKFSKPQYDGKLKIYVSDIAEGLRYETHREEGLLNPTLEMLQSQSQTELIQIILDSTKTWFSKPITEDWLKTRIQHHVEMPAEIEGDFEGIVRWQLSKLSISKETFAFSWKFVEKVADEKINFDRPETPTPQQQDQASLQEISDIPAEQGAEGEVVGVGPTRRVLMKREVVAARNRAARLLYKAEILTQKYCEVYGEDTDWENDDLSTDSESV